MVIYKSYQPFKSWLNKIKDKNIIKSAANHQAKKPRIGNKFMVLGANGYVGWATICQLVYKFGGCNIIAIDKDFKNKKSITPQFPFKKRIEILKEYFDFSIDIEKTDLTDFKVCKNLVKKYRPDFIINLADGQSKINLILSNILKLTDTHLIVSTNYNSKKKLESECKITEFKTSNVIGLCNLLTLIDPGLATYNNPQLFLNKMIYSGYNKKIIRHPVGKISVLSLEDFTRSFIKIIRKGQKKNYECYHAVENNILTSKIANTIQATYTELGIQTKKKSVNKIYSGNEIKQKQKFIKLIDKHRPSVIHLVSYSCKYYLEMR